MLRVVAPGVDPSAATSRPVTTARVETRPLERARRRRRRGVGAADAPPRRRRRAAPAASHRRRPPRGTARRRRRHHLGLAGGGRRSSAPFDEARSKGLVFRGKAGDPVLAAADGRVVYAGSGLRGYGNLVILKHNTTYLTAYAHNQTLLVKDDQTVKRGQKIAEMGSTDADGVQLHFEIRRQGKPIDPARLLPPR